MLEVNIYDNFNPNYLNISDYKLPNGQRVKRPIPNPKARCVAMDYELWETGYVFTSSATFSYPVEVGDIVEVLYPQTKPVAINQTNIIDMPLAFVYMVTDVDDGNKATLQNYFWAMIQGIDVPNKMVLPPKTKWSVLDFLADPVRANLMRHAYLFNSVLFNGTPNINRKAETSDGKDVAKRLFSSVQSQPYSVITKAGNLGDIVNPELTNLYLVFAGKQWNRTATETRIDQKQNIVTEYETVIERSSYNFAVVFIKNATTGDYTDAPKQYVCKDNGTIIDYSTYNGDGTDLPEVRKTKTLFYDEAPSISTIRAEISPSTIVTRFTFDQNPLQPLYLNDLVTIWKDGVKYQGYIADTVKTEIAERVVFVEGKK